LLQGIFVFPELKNKVGRSPTFEQAILRGTFLLGRQITERVQKNAGLKASGYAHSAEPGEIIFPVFAVAGIASSESLVTQRPDQ
jgi:hypothetical protein